MPQAPLGRELVMPLPLTATALLALNDHLLKGAGILPGWLTGKLSDVAGLFVFPILLFVALDALSAGASSRAERRDKSAIAVALVSAIGFSAVKLWPEANALASSLIGPMLLDASDLLALPACALAALWLRHPPTPNRALPRAIRGLAFALVALACMATSPSRLVRAYPAWKLVSLGARSIGCAKLDLWVSKSGKQGMGVTLEVAPETSAGCPVQVRSARFSAGPTSVAAATLPAPSIVTSKSHFYLPFAFDNETLWNEEHHQGRLELVIQAGDREERLAFGLKHEWQAPHRIREHRPAQRQDAAPPLGQEPLQFSEPPR